MKEENYFNFPVMMLKGIWDADNDKRNSFLSDILYYHIAKHAQKLPEMDFEETEEEKFKRSAIFWGVNLNGNLNKKMVRGYELLDLYQDTKVLTGINMGIFWQFYNDYKTDLEWHSLIVYLSLRSILGRKKYCKSNNDLLFSRMNGNVSKINSNNFPITEYHRKKIIENLELNWGLKYYSRYMRGFYFGFDIELEDLIFLAENLKQKNKVENLKDKKKKIFERWKIQNEK
ncbi:hypothetical protein [Elizabethkingia anophelis]|uniref:hypothetical protein n=1 Tax=Elizabethkingia anophelis TaxID=1117645 RepID=UPI003209E0F0